MSEFDIYKPLKREVDDVFYEEFHERIMDVLRTLKTSNIKNKVLYHAMAHHIWNTVENTFKKRLGGNCNSVDIKSTHEVYGNLVTLEYLLYQQRSIEKGELEVPENLRDENIEIKETLTMDDIK